MKNLHHMYYRGLLKSCNYTCAYCVFAKQPFRKKEITNDQKRLEDFCDRLKSMPFEQPISLMFTPYGEALIHSYYMETFAMLSKQPNIAKISCQTNFSFSTKKFMDVLITNGADVSKINLWCTFHPSMTSLEDFVAKVYELKNKINLCVGIVGDPNQIEIMKELRATLPSDIYLWINAMDGLGRVYTKLEVEQFSKIDPFFYLEKEHRKADIQKCDGGNESVFITANGDVFPCNRSKYKIGNFYKTTEIKQIDNCHGRCDCFLAYSNRRDITGLKQFAYNGENSSPKQFRIIAPLRVKVVFFDVDGTLITDGQISADTIKTIETIAQTKQVYLATMLPFRIAMKKCHSIRKYLAGGVFANGAEIYEFNQSFKEIIYIESLNIQELLENLSDVRSYFESGRLFKITINKMKLTKMERKELLTIVGNKYNIVEEERIISVTAKSASKLSGILRLSEVCRLEEKDILTVGNDFADIEMLTYFPNSVAVPSSRDEVKKAAKYVMEVANLPLFCK